MEQSQGDLIKRKIDKNRIKYKSMQYKRDRELARKRVKEIERQEERDSVRKRIILERQRERDR